jgi:hypothetical protein
VLLLLLLPLRSVHAATQGVLLQGRSELPSAGERLTQRRGRGCSVTGRGLCALSALLCERYIFRETHIKDIDRAKTCSATAR